MEIIDSPKASSYARIVLSERFASPLRSRLTVELPLSSRWANAFCVKSPIIASMREAMFDDSSQKRSSARAMKVESE
jgi:hypothetical protein